MYPSFVGRVLQMQPIRHIYFENMFTLNNNTFMVEQKEDPEAEAEEVGSNLFGQKWAWIAHFC